MAAGTMGWPAMAPAAAMVMAAMTAWAQETPAEPPGAAEFSAEITVERALVDEQGQVVQELPRSRYRIERFAGGRSRMAVLPGQPGPRRGPLSDASAGMVVEFDPALGTLRVLGKDGRPVQGEPPPLSMAPPELSRQDGLVVKTREASSRRRDLGRQFGVRSGSVRTLERYLRQRGERTEETLVSPASALPLEMNVTEAGELAEHHEFTYQEAAPGQLVRTRTRSESRVPGAARQRLVAVTTLADVHVAGGGK